MRRGCALFVLIAIALIAILHATGLLEIAAVVALGSVLLAFAFAEHGGGEGPYANGTAVVETLISADGDDGRGEFVVRYDDADGTSRTQRVGVASPMDFDWPDVGRRYGIQICRYDPSIIKSRSFRTFETSRCEPPPEKMS